MNFTFDPYKRENTQNSSNIFTTDKATNEFSFPDLKNFRYNDRTFLR
ncbi:hypothetical protein ABN52_01925 [Haemophilus influenzae]|nr:hypothetical protein ABN52_01925 [Haemophilus influenzae]OMQ01016.1 hypothetical protein BV935_00100 [Haemophilus influenzae]RFO80899.1 hypothetical protein CH550_02280 [Haemophilus influenzae]RFO88006.1 hypothetical protein CH551_00075 [Haemophilus influenzae]